MEIKIIVNRSPSPIYAKTVSFPSAKITPTKKQVINMSLNYIDERFAKTLTKIFSNSMNRSLLPITSA